MSIGMPPNTSSVIGNYGDDYSSGGPAEQLQNLIDSLRKVLPDYPNSEDQIKTAMENINTFLDTNSSAILKQCAANGWPSGSSFGPSAMISSATTSISNFLQQPNPGSLDEVNEAITQLHFEMTNKNS